MAIRGISFDFWNTLFAEPPDGFRFYTERRRTLLAEAIRDSGDFSREQIDRACRIEAESHVRTWREEHRTLSAEERLGKILGSLEVSLPEAAKRQLIKSYEEGILERPPILVPGAREAIERLASRYRLGVISDVGFSPGRVLREMLKRSRLIDVFDSLVFSDEAGRSKPHIDVFHKTARALEVEPADMVHVGDLEHTDIVGAKSAGYRAIRFTGVTPMAEGEQTIADRITSSFYDVPRLVEAFG